MMKCTRTTKSGNPCKNNARPDSQFCRVHASEESGEAAPIAETFGPLLSHYFHQDNAMWRAVGWAIPIEAGVLAGAYTRPGWPGLCLVVFGTVLIVALAMYAWKCWDDMNVNVPLIDSVKPQYPQEFRLTSDALPWYRKGRFWLKIILGSTFLANAFLLILEIALLWGKSLSEFAKAFFGVA